MDLTAKRDELSKTLSQVRDQGQQAKALAEQCEQRALFLQGAIAVINDILNEGKVPDADPAPAANGATVLSRSQRRRLKAQLKELSKEADA